MSKTIRRRSGNVNRYIDDEGSRYWEDSFIMCQKGERTYRNYVNDVKRWYHSDLPGRGVGDHASLPRSVRNFGQERPFRRATKQMLHRCVVDDKDFSLKRPKRDTWMYY